MKATTKINKSLLFKRAWYLVKTKYVSFSYALKMIWSDFKQAAKRKADAEICEKMNFSASTPFAPSAETMQAYYNSNDYKGD